MADPIVGIEYQRFKDIETDVELLFEDLHFGFAVIPLSEISEEGKFKALPIHDYKFDWANKVLGVVPPSINVDSDDKVIRKNSEEWLEKNFKWAIFTNVSAIMIDLTSQNNYNLVRLCAYHLRKCHGRSIWFRIKVDAESDGAWDTWNNVFSSLPEYQNKVGVVLEIGDTIPSELEMKRWSAELVMAISIATDKFVTNKENYPVLRKDLQNLVINSFKYKCQLILHGDDIIGKGIETYRNYLYHLYESKPRRTAYEDFAYGYDDYLQIPLQPLKDNLDNNTYEIFEKDPIKYKQYEEAVYQILLDRGSPVPGGEPLKQVVMVVGAGRGPLVRASLNASVRAKVPVKVYAVEKNECALVVLRNLITDPYFADVTIIDSDMREWDPPEKADILVSELLGSFSDNELSPECLDGAMRLMKDDGHSVPCEYTSYLAPLSSRKLFNAVDNQPDNKREDKFHQGYVVRLLNCYVFDKSKKCFVFQHSNSDKSEVIDNSRHVRLEFSTDIDLVLHGFAGYFDAKLYRDVYISILPETHSQDMFSWFPMYFPIKTPLLVKKGDKVGLDMWRVVEQSKVWYEWALTDPSPQPLHNTQGDTYWIGLLT